MTPNPLTPSVQEIVQNMTDLEVLRLQAENHALRSALREIAGLLCAEASASRNIGIDKAADIALKALGEKS